MNLLKMKDDINSPGLTESMLDVLDDTFNTGANPSLGYLNEQLALPHLNSSLLDSQKEKTFTMFQMLSSWRNPSATYAAKVDLCKTDSTGPDVGMLYGLNNYNSTYFEIWNPDLDWDGYNNVFQEWHDTLSFLCNGNITAVTDYPVQDNFIKIYPNPFTNQSILEFD